jgi:hypothetical protein
VANTGYKHETIDLLISEDKFTSHSNSVMFPIYAAQMLVKVFLTFQITTEMIHYEGAIRTLSTLRTAKPTSTFFRQIRHAEVVNTPASILFGGHHNNWGKRHFLTSLAYLEGT